MSKETIDEIIYVDHLPVEIRKGAVYSINQPNPNNYTHGFFKYPCKFIPEIPRWAMNKYLNNEQNLVLDPFSGSGTTLLEATINGKNSVGTEIDNFAKLLIKVKTTQLTPEEICFTEDWLNDFIIIQENYQNYGEYFVASIDNLGHWFTETNIQKLGVIKTEIDRINNIRIRDFLLICFGSIIRKCSNSDEVSPKPYVSTRFQKVPGDPFVLFGDITRKYLNDLTLFSTLPNIGTSEILPGDALNIGGDVVADLAITSPPYINAFDYARTLRLENLWLGLESESSIRNKKKEYVGTENIKAKDEVQNLSILNDSDLLKNLFTEIEKVDAKRALIVKKFFEDMKKNLISVHSKLRVDGKYCIVIGDSTIRKINIPSWKIIWDIAETLGFNIETYFSYVIQNHYLRIPRGEKGGKINKDYVLVLTKI
ncbi:DNA methyltransferase [Priestia koreensis]|uniref:DNA methyltransferase n=1 Tax=Priestia koreensis TaxID=284581 RepID=UPI003457DDAF